MSVPTDPTTTGSPGPVRQVLSESSLARIHAAIRDASDTENLLSATTKALYEALRRDGSHPHGGKGSDRAFDPAGFALPSNQWQAIVMAVVRRAEQWGTHVEAGLEMVLELMPGQYDDPAVPVPDLPLPDYRPMRYTVNFDRDALDVVNNCVTYLDRLRDAYGADSTVFQYALYSWSQALVAIIAMNLGSPTNVSKDGALSLLVRGSNGMVYGVVFHAAVRRCTVDGCGAYLPDDQSVVLPPTGGPGTVHQHVPSFPFDQPTPGLWSLHS